MTPAEYIYAARVPHKLKPQTFGLWAIKRTHQSEFNRLPFAKRFWFSQRVGFDNYTLLLRHSWRTIHLDQPEVVMEDSQEELQKHLPIWLNAKGRVLVTGMGLGCVVRGLLANNMVTDITVVEIDRSILRIIGHEFQTNRRVELIHCDAFNLPTIGRRWDYAWHDLWTDGDDHLQVLHARLLVKFAGVCGVQGCWAFPKYLKRRCDLRILK